VLRRSIVVTNEESRELVDCCWYRVKVEVCINHHVHYDDLIDTGAFVAFCFHDLVGKRREGKCTKEIPSSKRREDKERSRADEVRVV
jgi:hypothetical protein